MQNEKMADVIGVPEYFATDVTKIEDAGSGCVRIFNCIRRNGELIPVCTVVVPFMAFLDNNAVLRQNAKEILKELGQLH